MIRRVVLGPTVPREAFEALAHERGWSLYRVGGPDELEPYTSTWRIADQDTVVQYTEDDLLVARYVVLSDGRIAEAATAIEDRLETVTLDQAVDRFAAATTLEERGEGLAQAVIAADPGLVEPAVLDLIRQALSDPAPDLRRAAIAACTYLTWDELDSLLDEVTRRDSDPDVVLFATDALLLRRVQDGESS